MVIALTHFIERHHGGQSEQGDMASRVSRHDGHHNRQVGMTTTTVCKASTVCA